MLGDDAPDKFCLALCQSIDRDKCGSMLAVAYAYFCFSIALECMNMRRFMVVRPNDELKAVDEKDGWHEVIIPVRLGYSRKFKAKKAVRQPASTPRSTRLLKSLWQR